MFSGHKVDQQLPIKCNKLANKTNHQFDTNRLSTSCKSSPLKLRNFNNNNSSNCNGLKTTASTTNGSFRATPLEIDSGVGADENHQFSIKQENVIDDEDDALSETGTYTVEMDNQDPIAEEARKRIDEIFGVKEIKPQLDSMSNSSSNSSKPNSKHSFKISSIKKGNAAGYQDHTNSDNRTRHNSERGSTILKKQHNELQRKNSNSSTERLSFRNRRSSLQQQQQANSLKRQDSFSKSSVGRSSSSAVVGARSNQSAKPPISSTYKKSQPNQNINLINQNNTFVFNCSNINDSSNSLLNRARANSINRSLTKKVSRKDQLLKDDDTGSVKSEDASTAGSTDLSSINSEKCKSDSGQTASSLRFNRAFALRRARLGIDTPPLSTNSNKNNKSNPNSNSKQVNISKPNSQPISHIPITSASNHQSRAMSFGFDRSDGGRYSLRASSSSSSKPPINRLAIASKSKQQFAAPQLQQTNSNNSLNKHETSSLMNAISMSKNKVVNKMIKKNSFVIEDSDYLRSSHVRANSFGGQMKPPRLSSAASTSSNNTMSNASTSEDLSNISDPMNVKNQNLQHLSPSILQLSRRIYSTKPHYMAQTNSFRSRLEENGNLSYANELAVCDQVQSSNELPTALCLTEPRIKFGQLSTSSTPQPPISNSFNLNNSNGKSLSALDYLVLSAVHQLSFKLRCKLRSILDVEKSKYPLDNENRILIEELLPQVNVTEYRNSESSEKTISRDLSNVLKNLKRIEQSLEVINLLLESNSLMNKSDDNSTNDDLLLGNKSALLTNDDNFSLEI